MPTLELVLSHKHPDDREDATRLVTEVCTTGRPFSFWHRVLDAHGIQRQVLSVGAGVLDPRGHVVGVAGYLTDVTDAVRRSAAREVEEAIEGVAQSRPAIEQAKGALMLTYALDPDAAWVLLRRYSQRVNVKVRDVARDFVTALSLGRFPLGTRETWDALVADAVDVSTNEGITGQAAD